MSFQPLPWTWKSWMPRTIAAASALVYELLPAVWWTTAKRTPDAYAGFPRRIDSSARQDERGTIAGAPAAESVRVGTPTAGLQTVDARTAVTLPYVRTWKPSDGPTHHGLPSRQPPRRRDSALEASGASSASGAAGRQALQPPPSARMRKLTRPDPRQWNPIIVNRRPCDSGSARSPRSGTSTV